MIVCPNCNHQNPDGAVQCEACYTPLPATTNCPSCGATVQADAAFCGQCSYNLRSTASATPSTVATIAPTVEEPISGPPLFVPPPNLFPVPVVPKLDPENLAEPEEPISPDPFLVAPSRPDVTPEKESSSSARSNQGTVAPTRLQQQRALLIHVQSDKEIELPQNLSIIHLGKPNDQIPPDIDVAGFPNSEVVSRIHADIRVEGDAYYIEDVGSSNGTYINNLPLPKGNRHRLRPGDRVSLGKGDLVTFLFQLS